MPVGPCEAPAASNACDDVWSSVYVWESINTWELPPTILRWTFTAACPHAGTAWLVWRVVITSWQSINHTPERMKRCICNQSPVGRLACSHQDHNLREVWSCCMMRWGVTAASQRLDSLYECIYGSAQTSQSVSNIAMLAVFHRKGFSSALCQHTVNVTFGYDNGCMQCCRSDTVLAMSWAYFMISLLNRFTAVVTRAIDLLVSDTVRQ